MNYADKDRTFGAYEDDLGRAKRAAAQLDKLAQEDPEVAAGVEQVRANIVNKAGVDLVVGNAPTEVKSKLAEFEGMRLFDTGNATTMEQAVGNAEKTAVDARKKAENQRGVSDLRSAQVRKLEEGVAGQCETTGTDASVLHLDVNRQIEDKEALHNTFAHEDRHREVNKDLEEAQTDRGQMAAQTGLTVNEMVAIEEKVVTEGANKDTEVAMGSFAKGDQIYKDERADGEKLKTDVVAKEGKGKGVLAEVKSLAAAKAKKKGTLDDDQAEGFAKAA